MKTKSTELAENFKSGSTLPILNQMYSEIEEYGLQENKVINTNKFISFVLGKWVSNFNRYEDNTYSFLDHYIYQENYKLPIMLKKTLTKVSFVEQMEDMPELYKNLYAEMLLLEEQEVYKPLFLVGLFNQDSERQRIGNRIKQLREEMGITQDELAERVGMYRNNISRIESGKYSVGQDSLSKIAVALGKKLDFN